MEPESEILESPALIKGSIEVSERRSRSRRRFRGTVVKRHLARHLYGLLRRAPAWVVSGYLRYGAACVQLCAGLPGNPLLTSCRYVSSLAARRDIRHPPRGLYRAFVDGGRAVADLAVRLFREGADALVERTIVSDALSAQLTRLAREHGGVLLCVTHNPGAVFSSAALSRAVDLVLVSRNSPSIDRTKIVLDLYERMGVRVLMVRDGNPIELSRACLRMLKSGTVVVATVDRIDRHESRTLIPMFGQPVGFGSWAAKLAVHCRVPVVPAYVHTCRDRLEILTGEGVVPTDVGEAMDHVFRYFEQKVLEDPASWSFLADRRWRWVLRDGVAGRPDSDGGLVDPGRHVRPRVPGAHANARRSGRRVPTS